ncbi:AMIN domain-containing protein, partial [Chlorogloeopsis sp. ULAP02]|uniref:AMIN domain-containing protein n=1 Tax=Chlorogloeopsis sp. ULAP02 TaxID=3107926 RepID=UPI00398A5B15
MKLDKLFQSLLLTSAIALLLGTPAKGEKVGEDVRETNNNIPQLSEIELPATSAMMLVQTPTNSPAQGDIIQVTGVQAKPTDKGVEVILQTPVGEQLQITNRSEGNNFIADISNAQLRLPSGDAFTFRSQKPVEAITEITVTNLDANTIRVTVTGEAGLPTVELFDSDEGLIFGLTPAATAMQPEPEQPTTETPSAEADEPIELVVTGEQDGYRVPNTSTVTRTDTPLRDIPQSIQIIPQEVLRDQRANITSALLNAPSVRNTAPSNFDALRLRVRGFVSTPTLNGFKESNVRVSNVGSDLTGIERIEILQGPNSILFGASSPGGTVNFVTKQPLRDPFYFIEATVGSFNFYRGEVDLSGPLDESKKVLYRLNASYRDQEFFTDFSKTTNLVIAPSLSFELGKNTNLTIEGIYKTLDQDNYNLGLPVVGTILTNPNGKIPRTRITNEGDLDVTTGMIAYRLEHKFSESWSLSNAFR